MPNFTTFYVLNSLVNGRRGETAVPTGGGIDRPLADGHYYLLDTETDGHGPYDSREDAEEAGRVATTVQFWFVAPSESDWVHRVTSSVDNSAEGVNFKITRLTENLYEAEIEGSYERLKLHMTAADFHAVADVFAHTIRAAAKYQ